MLREPWRQLGEVIKLMDMDKECVQAIAIVCGTIVGVAALVYDGELGYAMGTGLLALASGAVGYLFGSKGGNGNAT